MRSRSTNESLIRVIRAVRRRWRLRMLLRGLAIVIGAGGLAFLISAYGMDRLKFNPTAVTAFRILAYGALIVLLVRYVLLPLIRRASDDQVALYLEEHEPTLEARLLSAVEFANRSDEQDSRYSPALVERLVQTAVERCEGIDYGRGVERDSLRRSSGLLAGTTMAALAVMLLAPGFVRNSTSFLLPWSSEAGGNPYSIEVDPGDTRVARGAEVKIAATLLNFESERVDIAIQAGTAGEWERLPMSLDAETGDYVFFLLDLNERTEYFVEAAGVRTPLFRVDVVELPYVQRLTLEYHYPPYTGLEPSRQEDGNGDIAAVRGTDVRLEITPTVPVAGGALVLESGDTLTLALSEEGSLRGAIEVVEQDLYRIVFETGDGDSVVGSPDYFVDPLSDQPPIISFSDPGRDIQVTSIEEIFTEVEARDDYGLRSVELVYSLNGGAEEVVRLYNGWDLRRDLRAGHTFYLEEIELEPGDFISYYARASDANRVSGSQLTTTDIYFMEVRPFDRRFRQADQAPAGGGAAGGFDSSLSRRQRDIIAATFNLVRDRARYEAKEYNENLTTLALAQGRLREQVEGLLGRISARGILQTDSTFQEIATTLPLAVEAMKEAEEQLGQREPEEALPAEQRALQQLQRAEAAFRDVQVARGNPSGGGGAGQPNVDELAELFELELDKQRNQYESVQRERRQQVDDQIDAVMQKLQELARRQQQENERLQARARRSSGGSGGGQAQRRLAEEAEDLARRLERLAREESLPELNRSAQRLRRAAEEMRRSASGSRDGSGTSQGLSALDELREARRLLDRNRSAGLERDVEDALRRAERLADQQDEMVEDVQELDEAGAGRERQVRRLTERKEEMAKEVSELEADLDRLSRESRGQQREAARKLGEAADAIRDLKIKEKIRYSRGVVQQRSSEYARNFEEGIRDNLDSLRERIDEARNAIGESPEQRMARALEQARDLTRSLESLRDRTLEQAERSAREAEGREGADAESRGASESPPAGQDGQRRTSDDPPNASVDGFPGFTPETARQFRRELSERRGEAERLRDALQREGLDTPRLDEAIGDLRRLERQRDFGDPRGLAELEAEVIHNLKEFEYALRRQLGEDGERQLLLTGSDEVPSEYRELVEQYYRSLAEQPERQER